MQKYIHKHLDEKYYITTSPIGNYGIYALNDKESLYLYPEYGDTIIKEIVTIFSIEKEQAKLAINLWANEKYNDIDFLFYWEHNATPIHINDLILPLVNKISNQNKNEI